MRAKLCGNTMQAHLTTTDNGNFLQVSLPLENASLPLWMGIQMATNATWTRLGASCGGCDDELHPAFFDVAPYQRQVLTTSLSIRLRGDGFPAFGGYLLDPIGSAVVGRLSPAAITQALQYGGSPAPGMRGTQVRMFAGIWQPPTHTRTLMCPHGGKHEHIGCSSV